MQYASSDTFTRQNRFGENLIEGSVNGTPVNGFIVKRTDAARMESICGLLATTQSIRIPTLAIHDGHECYFLHESTIEPADHVLRITGLQRLDLLGGLFQDLLELYERLRQLGLPIGEIRLRHFDWSGPVAELTLVDLSVLLAEPESNKKASRGLGCILLHLLGEEDFHDLEQLRHKRPYCPERFVSTIETLLAGDDALDIDQIRSTLKLRAFTRVDSYQDRSELVDILLHDAVHGKSQRSFIKVRHPNRFAVDCLAVDLCAYWASRLIINAADPAALQGDLSFDTNITCVLVLHADYLTHADVRRIESLRIKTYFLSQDKPSDANWFERFGQMRLFEINISPARIRELVRSSSLQRRSQANAIPSNFFDICTSISLVDDFFASIPDAKNAEDVDLSVFAQKKLFRILGGDSHHCAWLVFDAGIPIEIEYLQNHGTTSEEISGLIESRLVMCLTVSNRQFLTPSIRFNHRTSTNINHYISYLIETDLPAGEWVTHALQSGKSSIFPLALIQSLCSHYGSRGRFGEISEIIEDIENEMRSNALLMMLMTYVEQAASLRYPWQQRVISSSLSQEEKVFCLEQLIDHYKSRNAHASALDAGRLALQELGFKLSRAPSLIGIYLNFITIFLCVWWRGVEAYFGTKESLDADSNAAVVARLCAKTAASAYIVSPETLAEITLKAVTRFRGAVVSPYMPILIMSFGMISGNYAFSMKMAKAIYVYTRDLIDKFRLYESVHAVEFMCLSMIQPYVDDDGLDEKLSKAFIAASDADPEYASYTSGAWLGYSFYSSQPLQLIQKRIEAQIPVVAQFNQSTPITLHTLLRDYTKALKTDLNMRTEAHINENDGTAIFGYLCMELILSALRDDGKSTSWYFRLKPYIFGGKGQPILISSQQAATLQLFRGGHYLDLLKITLKFAFFSSLNPHAFWPKMLHAKAFLFGMFGLRQRMMKLLSYAAKLAEQRRLWFDAAIMHQQIYALSTDVSMGRNHAIHAMALYEKIGYSGCVKLLQDALPIPNRTACSTAQLVEFTAWLNNVKFDSSLFNEIESKLMQLLEADRVVCLTANTAPPMDIATIVEDSYNGLIYSHEANITHFCSPLMVDGRRLGTLYIGCRADLHHFDYLIAFANTVKLALAAQSQRTRANTAISRESQLINNLPILQHEIGQPLAAIISITDRLIKAGGHFTEDLTIIHDATREIFRIIDAVSELIPEREQTLEASSINIMSELSAIMSRMVITCENKGLTLLFEADIAPDLWITTDHGMLRAILKNLSDNAVKYTDRGEIRVSVTAESKHNQLEFIFTVEDTGRGISSKDLPRIFERNFRADRSTTRRHSSMGLGLFQVQRYVTLLNGQITAASELGVGSTFTFKCTFKSCEPVLNVDYPASQLEISALVVDDDPQFSMLTTRRVLEDFGVAVTCTTSPLEAIKMAIGGVNGKNKPFDIIFMDIEMPQMDGFDVAQALQEANVRSLMVALTSHRKLRDELRARVFGEVLRKPLSSQALSKLLYLHFDVACSDSVITPEINSNSLVNLKHARAIGLSDRDIKHYLEKLKHEFVTAPERLNAFRNEGNRRAIAQFAHALQGQLSTFDSIAVDSFADISTSDDPVLAIEKCDIERLFAELQEAISRALHDLKIGEKSKENGFNTSFHKLDGMDNR